MAFSKDFLWSGAVAGNQYEGGFQDGGRGKSFNWYRKVIATKGEDLTNSGSDNI